MIRLERKLRKEKTRLNKMIDICGGNLISDPVLKQSQKVDKLLVAYQKIKNNTPHENDYKVCEKPQAKVKNTYIRQ